MEVYAYTEKRKVWVMENNTFKYKGFSITAKAFTTERKDKRKTTIDISRKGSIIKEKCKQLTDIALELFPDRHIPNEDLAYLIRRYVGGDKETLRAYMGYYGIVQRSRRSGEGYVKGTSRKGYLEIFGFMHRITRMEWVIHAQMRLPNADLGFHTNEGVEASKEKISLSESIHRDNVEGNGKPLASTVECGNGCPNIETKETHNNNNNNTTERERNFTPKIFQRFELTLEEEAILKAEPLDSEPDLARKKCPRIEWKDFE